jgi:uncharacterized membrane protein YeaQ/YmgE (transglycosylase-associated protein family)
MKLLAEILLSPGGIGAWALVGLISGWLAGLFMGGGGYGLIGDIAIGLVGALAGGFLFGFLVNTTEGFWGSVGVSFVGACLLIGLLRAVSSSRAKV